jgi:glyoxalase-like protein
MNKHSSRRSFAKLCGAGLFGLVSSKLSVFQGAEPELQDCESVLDHIMVGAPELESGTAWFERLTGVRMARGGSHPGRGTQNALASLGPRRYIEVIAPDPAQTGGTSPLLDRLKSLPSPRPIGWAARTNNIGDMQRRVEAAGIAFEKPAPGSRKRPDGRELQWVTFTPVAHRDDGTDLLPFFIQWSSGSIHPSEDAPAGCTLERLGFESPHPESAAALFQKLGLRADIRSGHESRIIATLRTPRGRVQLGAD